MDKNKNIASSKKDNILVIRLSAMGDVAMTVPVLIALTKKYPQLHLTLVSNAFFEPFFEGIENVTFHPAHLKQEHKGIKGLYRLFKDLKPKNYTSVADLHNVIRSKVLDTLFCVNGRKVVQIDKGRSEKKAITREEDKAFGILKTTQQRYVDVFAKLGYPVELNNSDFLTKRTLSNEVQNKLSSAPQKWLGIAPFAAHEGKMYPLDLMQQVIEELAYTTNYKILFFGGGKKEVELLNNLESKFKNTVNLAGKFNFKDELAIISRLDAMLSMDSGNGHLAAMFGVPVVTIWGVTHPFVGFAPYGQPEENQIVADREQYPLIPTSVYGNKIPEGYEEVMRTIKPKTIINRIKAILE